MVPKSPLQNQAKTTPNARIQHAQSQREKSGRKSPSQRRHAHFPATETSGLPKIRLLHHRTQQSGFLRLRSAEQNDGAEVSEDVARVHVESVSAVFEFHATVSLFQLLPSVLDRES